MEAKILDEDYGHQCCGTSRKNKMYQTEKNEIMIRVQCDLGVETKSIPSQRGSSVRAVQLPAVLRGLTGKAHRASLVVE